MSASAESRVPKKTAASGVVLNVPNQLTALRLVLSVVLFCFIAFGYFGTGLALFVIAASTDWLDGYWARRYGQVTVLGRILDPFVDKVIICGTFIFLVAEQPESGVKAWMAVVIVGRELLVTALRGFLEGEGADFSAAMSGKLKFVLQCAAAVSSLYVLHLDRAEISAPNWLNWTLLLTVWSAVGLTVYSGVIYIVAAVRLIRNPSAPDTRI